MVGPVSPTGVSLNQTAITGIVRRHTTCAIGSSAPRFQLADFSGAGMIPEAQAGDCDG
jgi:hypothetical protein